LSSKPKKVKPKAEATKRPKQAAIRPVGKTPEAMVISRHGTGLVTRSGRGYSMGELLGAKLSPQLASKWGLRIDVRRRSVIPGNMDSLRAWGSHPGPTMKIEGRTREVEEEIEKVGRMVKKEAVRVEKEVVRVEKEVKEKAVKTERAVKRKAAKPKAKTKKKAKS
jgi:ribosomal protein L13E